MLSLSNAFNLEDMKDFSKGNHFKIDRNNFELSSEPKIDGISAALTYKNGRLIKGLSRGDGFVGEDILENLKTIETIPKKIDDKKVPEIWRVRGEVYIGKKDFVKIKDKFANQEIRQEVLSDKKTPKLLLNTLKFLAYAFGELKLMKFLTQSDYIFELKKWGFKTNPINCLL